MRSEPDATSRTLAVLATVALLLAAPAVGTVSATATQPTVELDDTSVATGETTTVTVRLTNVDEGLSGFAANVSVRNDSVATVVDVSFPDGYGLTSADVGGSHAHVEAVDVNKRYQPGDAPIPLVTVTIRGEAAGQTALVFTDTNVQNESGERYRPAVDAATVTVTASSDGGSSGESTGSTGDTGESTGDTGGGTGGAETGGSDGSGNETTTTATTTTTQSTTESTTTTTTTTSSAVNAMTNDGSSESRLPGFGVGAAVVALVATAIATLRRRDRTG